MNIRPGYKNKWNKNTCTTVRYYGVEKQCDFLKLIKLVSVSWNSIDERMINECGAVCRMTTARENQIDYR